MLARWLLVAASIWMVSCNGIDAVLNLTSSVTFNFRGDGKHVLKPGTYKTTVYLNEKNHYLTLEFKDFFDKDDGFPPGEDPAPDNDAEARFNYPEGMDIPRDNGNFEISATESGQEMDLKGEVTSNTTRSELRYDSEICQERVPRERCFHTPNGTQCEVYWDWERGRRDVEFYLVSTTRDTLVTIFTPGTSNKLGDLSAQEVSAWRDYTYEGRCRVF